jgi:hypothetical protein
MGRTVEQARKASEIAPTPKGKGLTTTIKVMPYWDESSASLE